MGSKFLMKSRHGTVYYFRRRVPDCLRAIIGKPYIVKSLNTCKKDAAIILARALAVKTDQLYYRLKGMKNDINDDDDLTVGFTLEVELDDFGKPSKIKIDAESHEQDAVSAVLAAITASKSSNHSPKSGLPPKPFYEAIPEYFSKSELKPNSIGTHRSKLIHAQTHFGGQHDVLLIEQNEFTAYCDHVIATKSNSTTRSHYIQTVCTFLNWHRIRAGLTVLTTKTLIPKRKTPEANDRDGFTVEQVRVLFKNACRYIKKSPHKFWVSVSVPLLGCRLEELAQINLTTDLIHDNDAGIWYLRIDEIPDNEGDKRKSVKKPSSWRRVPIHSALVRLGFIDFLLSQQEHGCSRPFEKEWQPRISKSTTDGEESFKWSHYISRWGGRELDDLVENGQLVKGNLTYFHSTRHTFSKVLGNAGVPSEIVEAICGRRYGGADEERYGKLKMNHQRLSEQGIEPGLGKLIEALEIAINESGQLEYLQNLRQPI